MKAKLQKSYVEAENNIKLTWFQRIWLVTCTRTHTNIRTRFLLTDIFAVFFCAFDWSGFHRFLALNLMPFGVRLNRLCLPRYMRETKRLHNNIKSLTTDWSNWFCLLYFSFNHNLIRFVYKLRWYNVPQNAVFALLSCLLHLFDIGMIFQSPLCRFSFAGFFLQPLFSPVFAFSCGVYVLFGFLCTIWRRLRCMVMGLVNIKRL